MLNEMLIVFFFLLFLIAAGSKESLLSATISANEEAMTILEEVIMYTFQQCVYYITKVKGSITLYVWRRPSERLPGLLGMNYLMCVCGFLRVLWVFLSSTSFYFK